MSARLAGKRVATPGGAVPRSDRRAGPKARHGPVGHPRARPAPSDPVRAPSAFGGRARRGDGGADEDPRRTMPRRPAVTRRGSRRPLGATSSPRNPPPGPIAEDAERPPRPGRGASALRGTSSTPACGARSHRRGRFRRVPRGGRALRGARSDRRPFFAVAPSSAEVSRRPPEIAHGTPSTKGRSLPTFRPRIAGPPGPWRPDRPPPRPADLAVLRTHHGPRRGTKTVPRLPAA